MAYMDYMYVAVSCPRKAVKLNHPLSHPSLRMSIALKFDRHMSAALQKFDWYSTIYCQVCNISCTSVGN